MHNIVVPDWSEQYEANPTFAHVVCKFEIIIIIIIHFYNSLIQLILNIRYSYRKLHGSRSI
jgi:hypothetical protein